MKKIILKNVRQAMLMVLMVTVGSWTYAADVPLGPGDVLKITVFGNPDLTLETRVSEAGSISYPLVGDVKVGGLSSNEAERKIAELLDKGGFVRKPQVNLMVTEMQSQQVSVLGQVNKPGRYPVDGKRSLTDILALAGGANEEAGDTVILTHTQDGKTSKEIIDLLELVRSGDPAKNRQLTAGDSLFVERAPRFYIYGEVQKPGSYKLERDMMVLQALSSGGGLSPRGTERGVRIKRRDANGVLQIINVKHDDLLKPNDIVYVKESLF
ncbi:putative polysaccharide export protein [Herminiimonas arsenicoxydans]|uniref:Polysaccharide export protein n=1 Tax=Herminiimonas arsenicoxydans TaxID=204773 RepID=A4G321_HERAR|nr:putative polysaccharide export protein [Herminiimonas arsenicoxydans]